MRNAISKINVYKVGPYRRSEDTTEGRINEQVIGQKKISRRSTRDKRFEILKKERKKERRNRKKQDTFH